MMGTDARGERDVLERAASAFEPAVEESIRSISDGLYALDEYLKREHSNLASVHWDAGHGCYVIDGEPQTGATTLPELGLAIEARWKSPVADRDDLYHPKRGGMRSS